MHDNRAFLAAAASSDNKIYAIGGLDDGQIPSGTLEAYDPVADAWRVLAVMPTPRFGLAAAISPDDTIYVLGGNNDSSTHLATLEAYDPTTDTWSVLDPMPTARRDLAATASGGRIFAIGGHGVDFPLTTMEIYNP